MTNLNDVLLAMSNIPVDDPIAEIWGRGLQGGYKIIEYTGTLPITIRANGKPLIDYHIYGNTVQNGTPTPENPITPIGCGVRTENLFDEVYSDLVVGWSIKYEALYVGEGQFTLSTNCPLVQTDIADLFFLSGNVSSGASTKINGVWNERSRTVASSNGYVTVGYRKYSVTHPLLTDYNVMLNLGSTPLPYEPYGYKLPMLSNSNVTNIYLGETQSTRRIKKLVLTGEEGTWKKSGAANNTFYFNVSSYYRQKVNITICSHYTSQVNINGAAEMQDGNVSFYANVGQALEHFYVRDSKFATVADLKSYLQQQYAAGTPVTVWYVLAEPETGILNEPLMKIGDYADTIDNTQANVQIPTHKGTTVIDYDGALKPSEMYIKYLEG